MRLPSLARLLPACIVAIAVALAAATQAAPLAQDPGIEQTSEPARIAIVHAAPFAAGDATVTVVATVLGQDILLTNDLKFRDVITYVTVPATTYQIKLYAGSLTLPIPDTTSPVLTETVTLTAGTDYTVAAVGKGDATYPLELLILDDTTTPPGSASAKLRVVHTAPFAPSPAGTAVDVIPDAGGSSIIPPALEPFIYGENTDFLTIPSGVEFDLKVVADGTTDPAIIDLDPVTFNAGDIVTVFAVGDGVNQAPAIVVLPFVAQAPAQVRLVHAAPFATGPATVTVTLNGQVVASGFDFGEVRPYATVPAGVYTAQVFPGTSATGTPAISAPLVLQDGQNYTVVAIGTGASAFPLKLVVLTDDPTAAPSATARLRIGHFAPFAEGAASGVDVRSQDGTVLVTGDLRYEEVRSGFSVPSGTELDLKVVAAGDADGDPIIDLPPLTFGAGSAFTVLAIGGANGQTPTVLLLDDQSVTTRLFIPMAAR